MALNALLHYGLDRPLTTTIGLPYWYRYVDNLTCRWDVTDGERSLDQVRRLLSPIGMTLKGADGVTDLAAGGVAQLLGFTLSLRDGRLIFGLGSRAKDHLFRRLGDAHDADNPPETARAAFFGWVTACGPAFEIGVADIPALLSGAADYGYREIASPDVVRQTWRSAWFRWQACRTAIRRGG